MCTTETPKSSTNLPPQGQELFKVDDSLKRDDCFFTVLESLPHPFYVIDANSYKILLANSAARGAQNFLNAQTTCYQLTHHRNTPCHEGEVNCPCPLETVKRTKKSFVIKHTHYVEDGVAREYEVHGHPIFDENGNVSKMIEYSLDITDRLVAQKEREILQKQIFHISKMASLTTLASGIAHELNNPLTGILGFAQIIEMQATGNEKLISNVSKIITSAMRMKAIIEQLGRFCVRPEDYRLQSIDLNKIIKSSLILLNKHLEHRNIIVELNLTEKECEVFGDDMKLENVFHNLILNSRAAFEKSSQTMEKKIVISSNIEGSNAIVTYMDNAGGIPAENIGRIFDPFFTTEEAGKGMGLGLSLVHEIIQGHKGEISVVSDCKKGITTFKISIPQ